jgi:RimJ/RimL family protein N-acetyltransferase
MVALEHLQIASPALQMSYSLVPWDSEIFGFKVAQISTMVLGHADPALDYGRFEQWCREQAVQLVSCRLSNDRLPEAAWLESRGFRFIETVYHPYTPHAGSPDAAGLPTVLAANSDDLPTLEAIASEAFVTGRFALDPRLDPSLNARRYRHWVRSSFDNAAHQVLKAVVDSQLVGFFVVEERPDGRAYWHLTAIAEPHRGQGMGHRVWQAMILWHARRGVHAIETTISGHNFAVMNLYARLGFRFGRPGLTFHWTQA